MTGLPSAFFMTGLPSLPIFCFSHGGFGLRPFTEILSYRQ